MIQQIAIDEFMQLSNAVPLADVRTSAEFLQGHVPNAFNIALFDNAERVTVGTTYKQVGREEAILLGFDLTGNKWSGFIRKALEIAPQKEVAVHCWRGGMRSGAMAWALNLYGFNVYVIEGGYKSYRKWVLKQFDATCELCILGGMTGSGKTAILHQLQLLGEQVLDLEKLARHHGSSYGTLGSLLQPTQEQFENDLALELSLLNKIRRIWVEDESLTIGKRSVPQGFWKQMRNAALINIAVPTAQRINNLVREYGSLEPDFLIESTQRIWKRLGPEQTRDAIAAIRAGQMAEFIKIVLVYYDKTYTGGLAKRDKEKMFSLDLDETDIAFNADKILQLVLSLEAALHSEK